MEGLLKKGASGLTVLIFLLTLLPGTGYSRPDTGLVQDPGRGLSHIADVTEIAVDLDLQKLDPPVPILFVAASPDLSETARRWQIVMLEARAFWRNMLGALPDGGLFLVDSASWAALTTGLEYGFPGVRVRTRRDGVLTLLAFEEATAFAEAAEGVFRAAPLAMRGPLLARDLASVAGAARYSSAWVWVQLGESLAEGLRIRADLWWQRRLIGATAAWMFLGSPRGRELAPDDLHALQAWGWFIGSYFQRIAVSLSSAMTSPPSGKQYEVLEFDARLLNMGRAIWLQYGTEAFERIRRAWPHGVAFKQLQDILDALWAQMPELKDWEMVLLDPRNVDLKEG